MNRWIHAQALHDPLLTGMATTFSALMVRGRSSAPGPLDDPGRPTMRVGYKELRVVPAVKQLAVQVAVDVVDQLVLADVDFFLLGNGVEDDFVLEGTGRVGADLFAVLLGVVLAFTVAAALLEVGFKLLFDH